jgi:hypothetical protein
VLRRLAPSHRPSPSSTSTPEVRALPSASITQPQQYYDPVRHPPEPSPETTLRPLPSPIMGLPQLPGSPFRHAVPTTPDGPKRVRLSVASPLHAGLPRISGGSASMTSLSRPAQASLTLRPAGLLSRPMAAFVTRLRPAQLPRQAARQLPGPTDNFLGGSSLHWLTAPLGRTEICKLNRQTTWPERRPRTPLPFAAADNTEAQPYKATRNCQSRRAIIPLALFPRPDHREEARPGRPCWLL